MKDVGPVIQKPLTEIELKCQNFNKNTEKRTQPKANLQEFVFLF